VVLFLVFSSTNSPKITGAVWVVVVVVVVVVVAAGFHFLPFGGEEKTLRLSCYSVEVKFVFYFIFGKNIKIQNSG
jgi:hypothetical protein